MSHGAHRQVNRTNEQFAKMQDLVNESQVQGDLPGTRAGEFITMQANAITLDATTNQPWLETWKGRFNVVPVTPPPPAIQPPPPSPPLPSQIGPFNIGPITFGDGIPVGGNASLTLFKNGTYTFIGHFHDSGAPSYNVQFVWVVVGAGGAALTFEHAGHLAGTFESGSRDNDWTLSGQNDAIAAGWADLARGYNWRWQADVNWEAATAVDQVVSALKTAGTTIAAVVAVVALP